MAGSNAKVEDIPFSRDDNNESQPDVRCFETLRTQRRKAFLLKWYLPAGLLLSLIVGVLWPSPGDALSDTVFGNVCVALIFVITGIKLATSELKSALKAWPASVLGVVIILLLTPLLAPAIIVHLPFSPSELTLGLSLFVLLPTTVSSGLIMVTQCNGNVGTALTLTVSTSLLGVVTVPLFLSWVIDLVDDNSDNASSVDVNAVPKTGLALRSTSVPYILRGRGSN